MEGLNIGLMVGSSFILVLSLVGNLALSVFVLEQIPRQTMRNYSYLILNLAVSDMLVVLSSIPPGIVERFKHPVFPFGPTMCKVLWPFQTVCSMASIFTVGALSYQRYRLIVQPCTGKLPQKPFMVLLTSIWVLPVLLAGVPYSFVLRIDSNETACIEEWRPVNKQDQMKLSFTVYLVIIQYVLPLGLIVWCNVKAIYRLKRYLKYRKRSSMLCALPIENHENAVKMLTIIMAVFAFFWLPGQVMAIVLEFEENNFIVNYGLDIGYLFVFANCVANPMIFAYFSHGRCRLPVFRRLKSKDTTHPTSAIEMQCLSCNGASPTETQVEKNYDTESGTRLMRSFLELMKTMKEDRLRTYLDSTPETVLT